VLVCIVLVLMFVHPLAAIPVLALFVGFMFSNSFRFVALNTIGTKVPLANERARYMSTQSAVQHIASATGAVISTWFLVERADKSLDGLEILAIAAIVLSLPMPFLVRIMAERIAVRASRIAPIAS
jgi:hypothetical protein